MASDPVGQFAPAPMRLVGEREERLERAKRRLKFHHTFLDDCLRGIGPNDLLLLGAETGAGKTDLATAIARANARDGKRVWYFALEAEAKEIERRTKYAFVVELAIQARDPRAHELSYPDWIAGLVEGIAGKYDAEADALVAKRLATLQTYYRGATFGLEQILQQFARIRGDADLVILDHLGYVDLDEDTNENRAYKHVVQAIRTAALDAALPVVNVAHLRKRDLRAKQLVPHAEDFHGSSELIKNSTHLIQLAPAWCIRPPNNWTAPTFMHVPKDRVGGATGLVALCWYDRRFKGYQPQYTLGRLTEGGTKWEALTSDVPKWAKHHRPVDGGAVP